MSFREVFERIKEVGGKVWDELERPGIQGAAEVASLLYQGKSFQPYGPGQQPANDGPQQQNEQQAEPTKEAQNEQELSRGMER